MRFLMKFDMIGTLRRVLFLAGAGVLIMTMSPLYVDAAESEGKEGREERCELNETFGRKAKKVKNDTTDRSIIKNEKTPRLKILPHELKISQLFAEGAVSGEVFLRAERAKTAAPAPAPTVSNNYRMALEEYLSLVSTLLPGPSLLQRLQPHAKPFLKRTNPAAGSLSPAGSTASLQAEKPPINSKHKEQRVRNGKQTRSVLYLDGKVRIKDQARIEI